MRARDPRVAERAAAEAYAAGAVGLEEESDPEGVTLRLYARGEDAEAVVRGVRALGAAVRVAAPESVPDADWSETWKRGLEATEVSPRLRIRPSFVRGTSRPGQAELVIDPGQAFGTGGHASTRLALEWVDALAPALVSGARVLDVGAGTGVLGLAALRLADVGVVAIDVDRLATRAARANAELNGLALRLQLVTGSVAALRETPFDLVLANLLRGELLPLLPDLAARTRPGGRAVFSGLLSGESEEVRAALCAAGFRVLDARSMRDASGEAWSALLTTR